MKRITKTTNDEFFKPLNLSAEDISMISHLSSINTDLNSIAIVLNIDPDEFEAQYMNEGSQIRHAIDEGIRSAENTIQETQLEKIKQGDQVAIKEFKKETDHARWQRYKKTLQFDQKISEYELLKMAIENGKGELPDHLQKYYEVLDFIRTLYNKMNTRNYIVSMVRMKWKEISYSLAVKLYYESLNFFNMDNGVKKEAWANIYADQLDMISNLALENNNLDIAGKYKVEAAKMRGVGRDEPPQIPFELLDRRPIFQTMNINQLGLQPANRRELSTFIDNLDISEHEKNKVKRDFMSEEISFELFDNQSEQ